MIYSQRMLHRIVLAGLVLSLTSLTSFADTLIDTNEFSSVFRGYSEASAPDTTEWRQPGFDDSFWEFGQTAFYYENQPASTTAYTGNFLLGDMFNLYTSIF